MKIQNKKTNEIFRILFSKDLKNFHVYFEDVKKREILGTELLKGLYSCTIKTTPFKILKSLEKDFNILN